VGVSCCSLLKPMGFPLLLTGQLLTGQVLTGQMATGHVVQKVGGCGALQALPFLFTSTTAVRTSVLKVAGDSKGGLHCILFHTRPSSKKRQLKTNLPYLLLGRQEGQAA
jgi:hypothetical protein